MGGHPQNYRQSNEKWGVSGVNPKGGMLLFRALGPKKIGLFNGALKTRLIDTLSRLFCDELGIILNRKKLESRFRKHPPHSVAYPQCVSQQRW